MKYDLDLLGQGLRQQRKKMGYTIENFAELIGISSSYLGLIERGQRYMSIETLFRVLETLDITLEEILNVDKPQQDGLISEEQESYGDEGFGNYTIVNETASKKHKLIRKCANLSEPECDFFIGIMNTYNAHKKTLNNANYVMFDTDYD